MEKLVKKAMRGHAKAFEELLIAHQEQLYRTAYLYAGNQQDSLDIVQDTAYKAFNSIKNLKEPAYFKTWLIRILINTALEQQRKKAKIVYLDDEIAPSIFEQSVASDNQLDTKLTLIESLNHLKSDYKEVLILHYYHDLSIKEISQVLAKPEGTIKTNLFRGRQQLKEQLEGEGGYERKID
ncbi:sigma-70 family RNA polymerase sigma factor [Vagococcus zengguangii]|uniref:Sigma-70 family RNA polymerase sigma factor n=1 Tax=Vagococcus zengguangii TaxID=2571750 RepID=A0A4D7CUG0_9ENTE|nr:sigma-70 family RNA polymerase sigma factor [Vagococcus zengguangii]QCI86007.1 sigma-70 family RNA polymerase sigma factor [Vagococcus zengguangii]TLG80246.1 sigma-70 family RNA polymerase sigma factor [Vagococcus zengguangii]